MQNRYVPDLGDFSKFAVIRELAQPGTQAGLRVGLVWYLNSLDEATTDGRHTSYLRATGKRRDVLRDCLPDVFDQLKRIRDSDHRDIRAYRQHHVGGPPGSVVYFEEPLQLDGDASAAHRAGWLLRAYLTVRHCELVLLDPDNGLETSSVAPDSTRGVKYATREDCTRLFDARSRSLVVYQHATRRGRVEHQAHQALARLASWLGVARADCFALRFHRGTSRLYLVVPSEAHRSMLRQRAAAMLEGPWGEQGHFSLIA